MKSITIRLPDGLKDLIADEAENNGQTQSDYLRQIIETHVGQIKEEDFPRESSQDLSLSVAERKTLTLGYQLLLASQGDLPEEQYDVEEVRNTVEALENGYAGEYPRIFAGSEGEVAYGECKLVWDILDMFRVIKYSIRKLGEDGWEQTGVIDAEDYGSFQGFDFQVDLESKLAGYVKYLVRTHRWEEQKEFIDLDGGNSHSEMLPTYRPMLATFKPIWRTATSRGASLYLNADDIRRVLLAAPGASLNTRSGPDQHGEQGK
ncbi:YfbU family protein [Corynebacterium lubricantis]|uniref:YfbU family protein n=1 Tax=Corynebacterium lubricantis TaxID=541095 RepID=UPI000368E31B|nr:YfbU family protein [Corynebacterium lubricantis]